MDIKLFSILLIAALSVGCYGDEGPDSLHVSRLQSYKKAFTAKRLMQRDIVKKVSSFKSSDFRKREEFLLVMYNTVAKVVSDSFEALDRFEFSEATPFPKSNNHELDEALSLVYENCALFSDIHLRNPDVSESLFKKTNTNNFKELMKRALFFCYNREDVYDTSSPDRQLLSLALQDLNFITRSKDFVNPYRKSPSQPQKTPPKKERKKLPRGPSLSRRSEL